MKFANLPLRIEHDIAGKNAGQIQKLISDIAPFIQFCAEESHQDLKDLLTKISRDLKNGLPACEFNAGLSEKIDKLAQEVNECNLDNVEPSFLYEEMDVFTPLIDHKRGALLGITIEGDLIRDTLLRILKVQYGLVRDYSQIYRVKDLLEYEKSIIICGYRFARSFMENEFPPERLIYMAFRQINDRGFRKRLIFPFLLKELDGIF